jgi:hypothetical protein
LISWNTIRKDAFKLISKALSEKNGLCAKWMPRPNVTSIENKNTLMR